MYRYVFVLGVLIGATLGCKYSPEQWCDSREIAKECQVYDICERIGLFNEKAAPAVNVSLYYESLCPGCRLFIQGQLAKAVEKVGDIMTVDLVPYGNAREEQTGSEWKFTCQHGAPECKGNVIESCAISLLKDFKAYWPFVLCLESEEGEFDTVGPKCASATGVDYTPIQACANNSTGNQIEHEMALKTEALDPAHTYTPWIVVNGQHSEFIQDMAQTHLIELVCYLYTGEKPAACSEVETEEKRCNRS